MNKYRIIKITDKGEEFFVAERELRALFGIITYWEPLKKMKTDLFEAKFSTIEDAEIFLKRIAKQRESKIEVVKEVEL